MSLTWCDYFLAPLIKLKTQYKTKNEGARGREKRIKEKLTRKAKQFKSFNLAFKRFSVSLLLRDMTVKENGFSYFQPTTIYVYIYSHPQAHTHKCTERRRRKIYIEKRCWSCIKGTRSRKHLFFFEKIHFVKPWLISAEHTYTHTHREKGKEWNNIAIFRNIFSSWHICSGLQLTPPGGKLSVLF